MVADIDHATSTRQLILANLSSHNVEPHGLLLVEQRKQMEAMVGSSGGQATSSGHQPRPARNQRPSSSGYRKTPDDTPPSLPQQDGKDVCLKFLSKRGCPSKVPVCASSRAAFISTQQRFPTGSATSFAAGPTRSVDEAQIESPPNLLSDLQQAGHTSSVDATQFESLQMRNLRKTSTNRAVDNPTTNRPLSRASGRKQVPFQRKAADHACTEIKQVRPTPSSTYVRECLIKQLSTRSSSHATALNVMCTRLGIAPPKKFPLRGSNQQWQLNLEKQRVVSALALEYQMSLQDIVEIVRAQSSSDPCPNKAMYPSRFASLLAGYTHKNRLVQIAREGIQPSWKVSNPMQTNPMKNHGSASHHLNGVLKAIRKGQDAGQYRVVDIKVLRPWKNIQIGPLGAVRKKDGDPE
ncbi:unnamed protein product [Phytophthora fragariaefolia]|uniref:Unnamed protein product n=1 Tax=Phytophthora fragariaefolia TaxID=1490495 RepID=A0A9W6XRU5_9STRA|nr:unnamed protein product [Phytophthora fragariaefolia]